MAISMTEAAAERVKKFLDQRGKGVGLRLGVKTMGCSGMSYVIEFVGEINLAAEVFEDSGVKVIVDKKSLVYLDGTELDYTRDGTPVTLDNYLLVFNILIFIAALAIIMSVFFVKEPLYYGGWCVFCMVNVRYKKISEVKKLNR